MTDIVARVVARYKVAKGISLIPRFQKALKDYEATGNSEEMRAILKEIVSIVLPNGAYVPPWFHGLGSAKRNAIKFLATEGRLLIDRLSPSQTVHDEAKWRSYMVMNLTTYSKKLRTLEIASEAGDEERMITVPGWKVVPMPGLTKTQVEGALEALEQATIKIKAKFPQVIYGDVYLSTHLQRGVAAWYEFSGDKFYLDVNSKKRFSYVYTICHELGHRYDHKFLTNKELRQRFWDLSTRKVFETFIFDHNLREKVCLEVLEAIRAKKEGKGAQMLSREAYAWVTARYTPGSQVMTLSTKYLADALDDNGFVKELMGTKDFKVPTDKLLHGPIAVTPYGGTKPVENFAEAFAHYVLDMDLAPEFVEIFDALK